MTFSPQDFFAIDGLEHSPLFEHCSNVWEALSKLESYFKSLELGRIDAYIPEGAYIIRPELVSIAAGCRVEAGAYIQGPCVIGPGCEVRHGAYIRGNVLVGSDCVVGHATEVKHSIFLNGAHAGHFNYVGDSILGREVNLGAGVKCANLRLDRKEVCVRSEGNKISTGLRKIGLIAGDGCQLGCNTVTNPGTLLGPNTLCAANMTVSGFHGAGSKILEARCSRNKAPVA